MANPARFRFSRPATTGSPCRLPARITATAATVIAATATAATIMGAGTATADPECAPFTAILVPGTTETSPAANPAQPAGLLTTVGNGLSARYGGDIDVRYLPYPAALAPYRPSQNSGVAAMSSMLSGLCASTRVVLAGYSQGADVVGDTAAAIGQGRGPIDPLRVLGVGLISDPRRDPATPQLGQPATGQGIAGPRVDFGALAARVQTVCATGDLYCSTDPDAAPALSAIGRAFTSSNAVPDAAGSVSASPAAGSDLDPSSVTRQVVIVLGGLAEVAANLPTIVDDLGELPARLAAGDLPGLHRLTGDLNTQLQPLVEMASKVDLRLVARALTLAAPLDQSGTVGAAAQIVNVLAGVDVARAARDIGTAQEIAWRALDKLTGGDPLGGGLELIGLAPIGADLAGIAAAALTGEGGAHLSGLASSFTTMTSPDTSQAFADLAREGGDAAQFYLGGVHQTGYDAAVHQVLEFLTSQIDNAR
ncbi:cutinase family protein [Nocardia brasiliensis]|uniref:cutinase family protein n=1 Tax=Nocardia brasiliensis TaxID=37326 RepID=UPI0024570914|nr:cutinase family protein [Nocardia brasiliensis]